mgnify:FL=1
MSFGIKPLGTRVVLKKMEKEDKTEGGIILSAGAKEKPQYAKIVAVGKGTEEEPMELKVGDVVIFQKYGGHDLVYKGEDYMIMKQEDILAVISE